MSVLQKLTEGIVHRDIAREGHALLSKWEKTGLLEGMGDDRAKNTMAVLLENQAKELLREASSMAAGDVEGFAAVAFPIVRRVFGGLIANDLVSVQPMSLPSGLIFFLDFSHQSSRSGVTKDLSVYGGNVLGKALADGVDLGGETTEGAGGFYDLNTGYSSPTGSIALADAGAAALGSLVDGKAGDKDATGGVLHAPVAIGALQAADKKAIRFDPDILGASDQTKKVASVVVQLATADMAKINLEAMVAATLVNDNGTQLADSNGTVEVIRRLTHRGYRNSSGDIVAGSKDNSIQFYILGPAGLTNDFVADLVTLRFPLIDGLTSTGALGSVVGLDQWGLEEPNPGTGSDSVTDANKDTIPEIDIKVDSIAVTAITKKLKAKWTPELGQDLNAYHNLDAEVELTGILSEHIALEIDQEILGDLINGAKAGTRYWSRAPGLFVDSTGAELGATSAAPDFTGTVSEWYETLIETINDVSAQIHRKTLRGGANFVVCSPEVANILEFTSGFRASVTADQDKGTIGAVKSGSLSKKFDVFVDPYFPRNVILVGRKGGSFLESGYVYAPYVPLQVTPTIFGTEDFVPRKGVMTRYAKKMVRPDMYGLVVVRGLLGESGS
jgi:hypothetical protein